MEFHVLTFVKTQSLYRKTLKFSALFYTHPLSNPPKIERIDIWLILRTSWIADRCWWIAETTSHYSVLVFIAVISTHQDKYRKENCWKNPKRDWTVSLFTLNLKQALKVVIYCQPELALCSRPSPSYECLIFQVEPPANHTNRFSCVTVGWIKRNRRRRNYELSYLSFIKNR